MKKQTLLFMLTICWLQMFAGVDVSTLEGIGTLTDPFVVSNFPLTVDNVDTQNGQSATGMQGTCFTLPCCSIQVFKVSTTDYGSLYVKNHNFLPLSSSIIAYEPVNSELPVNDWSDLAFVGGHPGNFCGFRDTLLMGRAYNWNYNYWDTGLDSSNPMYVLPPGDYYLMIFTKNNQVNLGGAAVSFTFDFKSYCPNGFACGKEEIRMCEGEQYVAHSGDVFTDEGVYTDTIKGGAAGGLDSLITISLVFENSEGVDVQSANEPFTWIDGNVYTESNVTATHTLTDTKGCDSVVTLNLTYYITYFVDSAATGANDGSSWANAFNSLQSALDVAVANERIFVAKGTYFPSQEVDGTTDTQRKYAFKLVDSVKVYGGFAGTESSITERTNYGYGQINETILSGDFNQDDVVTGSGSTLSFSNYVDNAYHVIYNPDNHVVSSEAVLDGFTVRGGYASGTDNPYNDGAGIYNVDGQTPIINQCAIVENYANDNAGGVYMVVSASRGDYITNCTFYNNRANDHGGALGIYNSTDTLGVVNCLFDGNSCGERGGAIWISGSKANVVNSTIVNNYTAMSGGGMYVQLASKVNVVNSILWGNTCVDYGPQVRNYDNGDAFFYNSCIELGLDGVSTKTSDGSSENDMGGIIASNPYFMSDSEEYPFALTDSSACVNAGLSSWNNQAIDIRGTGFYRVSGDTIDIGAYEYAFPSVECPDNSVASNDGTLTALDAEATYQWLDAASAFAEIPGETSADFTPATNGSYAVEVSKNGCTDTSAVYNVTATGLENDLDSNFDIFPNPTTGIINIQLAALTDQVQINVRDLNGVCVYTKHYHSVAEISFDLNAPTGLYLVELMADGKRVVTTLSKK